MSAKPKRPPRPKRYVAVGQRFGRGVVTDPEARAGRYRGAKLRCDCGAEYSAPMKALHSGNTRSCGCLAHDTWSAGAKRMHAATTRHGLSGHPLYDTWRKMVDRCTSPSAHNYALYGSRGVSVHAPWLDARAFVRDIEDLLGDRPAGMTLDRINGSGNYEPGNVRWATRAQQSRNRRTVKLNDAMAREIFRRYAAGGILQAELAAEYGVTQTVISNIARGDAWN